MPGWTERWEWRRAAWGCILIGNVGSPIKILFFFGKWLSIVSVNPETISWNEIELIQKDRVVFKEKGKTSTSYSHPYFLFTSIFALRPSWKDWTDIEGTLHISECAGCIHNRGPDNCNVLQYLSTWMSIGSWPSRTFEGNHRLEIFRMAMAFCGRSLASWLNQTLTVGSSSIPFVQAIPVGVQEFHNGV